MIGAATKSCVTSKSQKKKSSGHVHRKETQVCFFCCIVPGLFKITNFYAKIPTCTVHRHNMDNEHHNWSRKSDMTFLDCDTGKFILFVQNNKLVFFMNVIKKTRRKPNTINRWGGGGKGWKGKQSPTYCNVTACMIKVVILFNFATSKA